MKSTKPPSAATIALFEAALTDDLLIVLVDDASSKLRGLVWRGRIGGAVPGAKQGEDLVQTAIERTLIGSRKWDPAEVPNLQKHLEGVVDSLVSALVEGAENRRGREIVPESDETTQGCIDRLQAALDCSPPTEAEESENSEFMLAVCEEVGRDDPTTKRILEIMLFEQIFRREAIATAVSITPDEFTNAIKRFKRRWPKLVAQFSHLNPPKVSV